MLNTSLQDFMVQRQAPLTLNEIRPITCQLLVAFTALKEIDILYTDLKPDNIMLVNHQDEPFRVKLIDFSLAIPASEVTEGMVIQPCAYRAPEVSLGLPISEAIDMWSLGCVLACLFFGQDIFKGDSTYNVMKTVCCLLGQPQDHLLNAGKTTNQYFKRNHRLANSRWTLKTPEESKKQNDNQLQLSKWRFDHVGNLADAVDIYSDAIEEVELEDTRAFLNLLQMLLNSDSEARITPQHALKHSFVTMNHLADYAHRGAYAQTAFELMMVVYPACGSDKCHEYLSNFESNMKSTDSGDLFSNIDNSSPEEAHCIESNWVTPTPLEPLQEQQLSILCNKSVQYKIVDCIGEGDYGQVVKCVNLKTNGNTAIKFLKNVDEYAKEVEMLEKLRTLDPEKNNLVRFMDSFIIDDMSCITFELLDRSLYDLTRKKSSFTLSEIRPITCQLLVAFNALKEIGILYTDLKPDNIMLVNHQDEPFKVKLIDFGLAIPASEVMQGKIMQPRAFRAPEVSLGLPISEAIDMWSLGCVLASLFFGHDIFNGDSTYDVMKTVCCLLGQPLDHLLDAGKYTNQFFKRNYCSVNSGWTLKTPEEYKKQNDNKLQLSKWPFDHVGNLTDAVDLYLKAADGVELKDRRAFLNLLQMLLNSDAESRITPQHALKHSFVTMSHLADYAHRSAYTQTAFELMVVCPVCDSNECDEYLNSSPEEAHCTESNCVTLTSPEPSQKKKLSILCNKSVQYKVLDGIGEGCFGQVVKCVNMKTNENTAIKFLKNVDEYANEVEMLEKLRTLDPEKNNLVRFMDSFIVDDMSCITFELLDMSLQDLMIQKQKFTLNEIRPITCQLLVAFNALKRIGLLYTDLKLNNIMLVNHQDEPFRVKLIDFGLAMPTWRVRDGMIIQPYAYRAPEVSLGLPISEAIDMWSLGCVLAFLFFGRNIFNNKSTYNVMKTLCCLLGQPQDHLLDAGKYTHQYFKRNSSCANSRWTLKTPEEFREQNANQVLYTKWRFNQVGNLADAVDLYSKATGEVALKDKEAFLNLLQMLLNSDAETRITPQHALEYSFVTMSHLADYAHKGAYIQTAYKLMVVCPEYLSSLEAL